jgi:hypothetical protein
VRIRTVLLVASLALTLAVAAPAAAQSTDTNSAAIAAVSQAPLDNAGASPILRLPKSVSFTADDQAKPGAARNVGGQQVVFMVQGGLVLCCSDTGFAIGAGAAFSPMKDDKQVEINADFHFTRFGGDNGVYISFNGQYNVKMDKDDVTPFVLGGLAIVHSSGETEARLQLGGGVQFKMSNGRAVRAQVRFILTSGNVTTVILGGFAF